MSETADLFTEERRAQIATLIIASQRVTIAGLQDRFRVSAVTLRKDLAWLEAQGKLVRTHGGAIARTQDTVESAFAVREDLQRAEKARIGQAAADGVRDGDTIALDASTTALALARCLKDRHELTVITSGLRIAQELAGAPGITVFMPGGMVRPEALSLVGGWSEDFLKRFHITTAFVGAQGITTAEGLTDVNADEVAMKRALVAAARGVIVIADQTKWGHAALATFCPLPAIQSLITDGPVPADLASALEAAHVHLIAV